jgi:hypothetical protein
LVYWPVVAAAAFIGLVIVGGVITIVAVCTRMPRSVEAAEAVITRPGTVIEPPPVVIPVSEAPSPQVRPSEPQKSVKMSEPVTRTTVVADFQKAPAPSIKVPATIVRRRPPPPTDDLLRDLLKVKEIDLTKTALTRADLVANATRHKDEMPHPLPDAFARHDLGGLPFRKGYDCMTPAESAKSLEVLSRKLRSYITELTDPGRAPANRFAPAAPDPRINPADLKKKLLQDRPDSWFGPEGVATLMQMLQAEDRTIRALLLELLGRNDAAEATRALARRAVFDVSAVNRETALKLLSSRPAGEVMPILLESLRYPWAPAADFAAEAMVNLQMTEAVPSLLAMLDAPDPTVSITKLTFGDKVEARELVRVNHLKNCMLCHAPSLTAADAVRGRIPVQGQPLPPAFSPQYYADQSPGAFVRADITYLQQDFAVQQYVPSAGSWPQHQRFDYLVRTRPLMVNDPRRFVLNKEYPQRESVLWALRELTGKDFGRSSADWKVGLADWQ